MENLKIRVMTEQESKEAQELFFELGGSWHDLKTDIREVPYVEKSLFLKDGWVTYGGWESYSYHCGQELTLPQLRDKVVLHRNDVRDATHSAKHGSMWYLGVNKYAWRFDLGDSGMWELDDSKNKTIDFGDLNPINKSKGEVNVENSISKKEAFDEFLNGGAVEFMDKTGQWRTMLDNTVLKVFLDHDNFRLKPRTIKIGDVEVPAPFDPKIGGVVWYLDDHSSLGYSCSNHYDTDITSYFGWWRTESEIKQVVAALRKLIGVAK